MPRKAAWPPPIYSRDGRDRVRLRMGGTVRDVTLGPTGSAAAGLEYARIVAEISTHGRLLGSQPGLTVASLVAAYHRHLAAAGVDYRQKARVVTACRSLQRLYGHTEATAFGPLALATVRNEYVLGTDRRRGRGPYCRRLCNQMAGVVVRAFRWAASQELVPESVAAALATLDPLRRKRTAAPDRPKVRPADRSAVDATLPHLTPVVADLVRFQLATGCRPGEACALRPCDVDPAWRVVGGVTVWLYSLDEHKGDWRGAHRWIPVGPRGQAVLAPYLGRDPLAYCFSPREAAGAWLAANGRAVHFRRKRAPGVRYTSQAYAKAVRKACTRAGVTPWAPNQLRHLIGTEVEVRYDRDAARCVLGHTTPQTTAIYAESVEKAAAILAQVG